MEPSFPSSSPNGFEYDVFLSFRGETRNIFTGHLHQALVDRDIKSFIDRNDLEKGDDISRVLLEKLERSEMFIVVLSKGYPESRWCVLEMEKMIECNRFILPIFYSVDPGHFLRETGPLCKAFQNSSEEARPKILEKLRKWREDFTQPAGSRKECFRSDMSEGDDVNLIQVVTKEVLSKLSRCPLNVSVHPIAVDLQVKRVIKRLDLLGEDVKVVAICGIGGIGKTTLVKALYNKIYRKFDVSYFMENIRREEELKGIVGLQNQLIQNILKLDFIVNSESQGKHFLSERIGHKKSLIILDDVSTGEQLSSLVNQSWFHKGSRIIITSRDENLFKNGMEKTDIYHPKELGYHESLKLFSWHAFRKENPEERYTKISEKIVSGTYGVPLYIEVIGSFLFNRRELTEWEEIFLYMKQLPWGNVHERLKISFDFLNNNEKAIFLDMACVLGDIRNETAIHVWNACNFAAESSIRSLLHKSLIKIDDFGILRMHDSLQEMGRRIVREETKDLGRRSRLWAREEILTMLDHRLGTSNVEGIRLIKPANMHDLGLGEWNDGNPANNYEDTNTTRNRVQTDAFSATPNLRLLSISDNSFNADHLKHFPEHLKYLEWQECPSQSLPNDLKLNEAAYIDLSHSKFTQLWDPQNIGESEFNKLKILNLKYCIHLTTINFSGLTSLVTLFLDGCESLVRISESIGCLESLIFLSLRQCVALKEIPDSIARLASLKVFLLDECSELEQLPNCIHQMNSLETISLNNCINLKELPYLIFQSTSIKFLQLSGCCNLENLHDSTSLLSTISLESIDLTGCFKVTTLPDCIAKSRSIKIIHLDSCPAWQGQTFHNENLEELGFRFIGIMRLPESVESFKKLRHLDLSYCLLLAEIPDWIGNLSLLEVLKVQFTLITRLPDSICSLKFLRILDATKCIVFSHLPESIGHLDSLSELNLQGTMMKKLPDSLGLLRKLKKLDLRSCRFLKALPDNVGGAVNLTVLLLDDTDIEELPESIGSLRSLEFLSLRRCRMLKKISVPKEMLEETRIVQMETEEEGRQLLRGWEADEQRWILAFTAWMDFCNCGIWTKIIDRFSGNYLSILFYGIRYAERHFTNLETEGMRTIEFFKESFSTIVVNRFRAMYLNPDGNSNDAGPSSAPNSLNLDIPRQISQWIKATLPHEFLQQVPNDLNDTQFISQVIKKFLEPFGTIRDAYEEYDSEVIEDIWLNFYMEIVFFSFVGFISSLPANAFCMLSRIFGQVEFSDLRLHARSPGGRLSDASHEQNQPVVVLKFLQACLMGALKVVELINHGLMSGL